MQFVFGSGQLFAQPEGFDNGATSPVQVGALRGVSVEMGFNPKALHGGGHWPLAIGRGTGKVPCKAEFAQFTADGFNALFFGGPVPTTGSTRAAVDEVQVISGNAVAATHAGTFALDLGVTSELPSGALFTRVPSAPAAQEYTCNETTGAYGFAPGSDGNAVRLNYLYADAANGRQITIANRNIGHTPRFSAVLTETFNGKSMTLTLPHCVASRLGMSSKANDFMVPSFSFGAAADDSGLVGTLNMEEGDSALSGEEMLILFRSSTDTLEFLPQYQAFQNTLANVPVIAIGGTFDAAKCSNKITLSAGNTIANITGSGPAACLTSATWYGPANDKGSVVEFKVLTGSSARYYIGGHAVSGGPAFDPDVDMQGDVTVGGYRSDGTAFTSDGSVVTQVGGGAAYIPLVSGDVIGILAYGRAYYFINGVPIPGLPEIGFGAPFITVFPMIARY